MKKLLGLLVISFLFINTAYSREYPNKIFGINLFDKFDSYVSDKSKYSGKLSNLKKPWPYLKVKPDLNLIQEYSFSIASIYVDSGSKIVGIITDGDIRRMLETNEVLTGLTAASIMSKNPKQITVDAMATEALDLLETNSITQLLAVDSANNYAGVVHLHDLIKEGIL
mgnify:CR=1 FL=1